MSSSQENSAKILGKCLSYSSIYKNEVIKVVRDAGNNVKKGEIAKKFSIPQSTLFTFLKQEKDLRTQNSL